MRGRDRTFRALRGVIGGGGKRDRGRDHRRGAVAECLEQRLHLGAERRNRRIDGAAPALLVGGVIVFLLQTHAIGHILMGRNPAAIRCRLVGGIERAATARWEGPLQRSAGRDPFHDLVVVLLDIKASEAQCLRCFKQRRAACRPGFATLADRSYMRRNSLFRTIRGSSRTCALRRVVERGRSRSSPRSPAHPNSSTSDEEEPIPVIRPAVSQSPASRESGSGMTSRVRISSSLSGVGCRFFNAMTAADARARSRCFAAHPNVRHINSFRGRAGPHHRGGTRWQPHPSLDGHCRIHAFPAAFLK